MFDNISCITSHFPWDWFLALLLPLLGLWWWLSGRIKKQQSTIASLEDRINYLEGELEACRKGKGSVTASTSASVDVKGLQDKIVSLQGDLDACKRKMSIAEAVVAAAGVAAVAAPAVAAAPVAAAPASKKDDLKIVEGIGPKIEELFNNAGIYTFAQLASTPSSRLKEILDAAGSRFQIHDPKTWPDQSALARDGKFDELKKWQDELNKGRA